MSGVDPMDPMRFWEGLQQVKLSQKLPHLEEDVLSLDRICLVRFFFFSAKSVANLARNGHCAIGDSDSAEVCWLSDWRRYNFSHIRSYLAHRGVVSVWCAGSSPVYTSSSRTLRTSLDIF